MRWRGVTGALFWAIIMMTAGNSPSLADADSDRIANDDGPSSQGFKSTSRTKALYFSGFDLWRNGGTAYGGMLWSPNGLNNDGFTFKLLLAGGRYLYQSESSDILGANLLAAAMPGWRVKRGDVEIKVFAGLDLQRHVLSREDPGNSLRGNHAGFRGGAELWWEPLPAAMMVSSAISASTIGNSFGVRGAAGWRAFNRFWTGPEIEASGDDVYRQFRFGAHITSFKFNDFEWTFGAGFVEDNAHRSGLYGRFSFLRRN